MPSAHQKYGEMFMNRKPKYCQLIQELLPGNANAAVDMVVNVCYVKPLVKFFGHTRGHKSATFKVPFGSRVAS